VVAATISKPGVVLRRPAGSTRRFAEHSELPNELIEHGARHRHERKPTKPSPPKISDKAARKAALEFEREQGRRDAERRREEAGTARERERRDKAQTALDEAKEEHQGRASAIDVQRATIEKRAQEEEARWRSRKKS
jgi:colicin import membrane protein